MKLRNKRTGEIVDDIQYRNYSLSDGFGFCMNGKEWEYHSLAELNEEWEDYEENEYYYAITSIKTDDGITKMKNTHDYMTAFDKSIGNYFETKEDAKLAVEKLKAWQQLKQKLIDHVLKYEFDEMTEDIHANISFTVESYPSVGNDLDLLFGGEE